MTYIMATVVVGRKRVSLRKGTIRPFMMPTPAEPAAFVFAADEQCFLLGCEYVMMAQNFAIY